MLANINEAFSFLVSLNYHKTKKNSFKMSITNKSSYQIVDIFIWSVEHSKKIVRAEMLLSTRKNDASNVFSCIQCFKCDLLFTCIFIIIIATNVIVLEFWF